MHPDWEKAADALAAQAIADGEPTAWFDRLYSAGRRGDTAMPWDRDRPNQTLVEWAGDRDGTGHTAVVVGCGLGQDAELIARLGFTTTAFDVSANAVDLVLQRFPHTDVHYRVADLLRLAAEFDRAFDLVVESFTVQALPLSLRAQATAGVRSLVAPGGTLVVIASARVDEDDVPPGPPWPLSPGEIAAFGQDGLVEEYVTRHEMADPGQSRWLAEFRRAG